MTHVQTTALPLELRFVLAGLASAEVADDQQWILALLRQQGAIVLTVLWRMLGSEPEVLDAYQTAVCSLTAKGRESIGPNPGGYFYRTAVNTAIEVIRARQRRQTHWPRIARIQRQSDSPDGVPAICDQREMLERMRLAICELPRHLRNVIILRDLAQLPYADVARMLGIRPGTARLYRRLAVIRLADLMGGEA
ncbi:MAG TPA: sigma-70 family RNA polymerase sigma factor [Phycisphaerae bacterium]|nr:sigma-70 family RNA polymerase sigma factor [Phycisphaerae bacterium]